MGFEKKQAVFTYVLSGTTLTITEEDGITAVALKLTAGAGNYFGNKNIKTVSSSPISLAVNEPVTISSEQTKYIDELTIDASAGTIEIIAR